MNCNDFRITVPKGIFNLTVAERVACAKHLFACESCQKFTKSQVAKEKARFGAERMAKGLKKARELAEDDVARHFDDPELL